ncbi:MAG TPA: hypothetical protein VFZ53_01725 [Polyangiaceae bacterium]
MFLLGSAPFFACGSLFGIDSPRIVSDGGAGGDSGRDGGAAGESPTGGVAGTASGRGGTHASGSGGASGSGAGSGGSAGEEGGAGGEPGPDPGPTLGEACDANGEWSCTTANPNITLACEDGTWRLDSFCRHEQRCNPATAECEGLSTSCVAGANAVCASDGGKVIDCSVSQFQPPSRICPYGCQAGRCSPGTGDELIVHTEDDDDQGGLARWSIPIPVCFLKSDTDVPPAWIRSEVERTWGRYLNVEFTGWGECSSPTVAGVVIEFLENCELRLGGKPPTGSPGREEQSRVGICKSYRNAAGELEEMKNNEPLLRFVVRHQFGHVLGLDESEQPSTDTVMVRALEKSNAARLQLTHNDVNRYFAFSYQYKPPRTLVTTSGLCLTAFGSTVRPAPCSQSGSGRFLFNAGEVQSALDGVPGCLTLSGGDGDTVGLAPCGTASSAIRMARARWSTPDRCVAPDFPAPGSAVSTGPCAPVGDPAQAWFFEPVASERQKLSARIRFSPTGDCLSVPGGAASLSDTPLLEACGQTVLERHVFYLWINGQISFGVTTAGLPAICLQWNSPDSTLYFGSCNFDTYWLSGALETADGLALTIEPSNPNAELRAVALGANVLPSDDQIFDFSF